MKCLVLLFTLCFIPAIIKAQSDSIEFFNKKLDSAQTVEAKVDLLNKLAYEYTQLSLTSAETFAHEALENAVEVNYEKGMASSYNNLGISHSIQGDYTAGLDYFYKALKLREGLNDLPGASNVLNNIARVFHYQGDFGKAIEYSNRSVEMLQKVNDSLALALAYVSLGDIYLSKLDKTRALATFETSRKIFARKGTKNQEGWSLLKIANAFEADKDYQQAMEACIEAKKLIDVKTDLFTTIELNQSMGSIYAAMGNQPEAQKHLYEAMELSDEGKDSNGSISSRLKLSNMFKQFDQYDSALHYMEAYVTRNTEAFNAEKSRQLSMVEKMFETEKKDKLLELKNAKIKEQSLTITIISVLLIAIATLGFVIYRYYRAKKQSAMSLEKLNKEIYEKHEEILAQSEELVQANEEIRRMNESLEAEVMLRADKIDRQNKILIDYAYFNAHSVRGPLARILGLSMLMERENTVHQIKEYNSYLITSALELDNVIKEINLKLGDE